MSATATKIDPFAEDAGFVRDLLAELPNHSRIAPAQVHRWTRQGINGHRLPVLRFRGRLITTRTAIREWLDAVSAIDSDPSDVDHEAVEAELKARGYI